MSDLRQRPGDQPLPVPNSLPDVQSMVIDDITARRQVGIERYGSALQPHNGRDGLRDLYEELLDAACYTRQLIEERIDPAVEAEQRRMLEILDLPISDDIFSAGTVRGFLIRTFLSAWNDNYVSGESDWRWRLYEPLARAGHIKATFAEGEDDYIEDLDQAAGNELVAKLIAFLGQRRAETSTP